MRRRAPRTPAAPQVVPAVLPLIVIEPLPDGALMATVNGNRLAATPFPRAALGETITALVARLGSPARVEVHDADGAVYADIVRPEPPRSVFAPPPAATERSAASGWREFRADGFVPGEDVALAVIVAHSSAAHDGRVRVLLDSAAAPVGAVEVVLLGRISRTVTVQRSG